LEGILGVGRVSHSVMGVPIDCSLPGSSAHGISQAGILEWVAILLINQTILTLSRVVPISLLSN